MGLDLVSFAVLDSELADMGLDLVSSSSIYSKVNSLDEINSFNTLTCPALKIYVFVLS